MSSPLEPILKYKMSKIEAKAFKVSLLWEAITQKEYPDYKHVELRKNGDPRKSLLFKYCFKLVQETKGLLEDKEYKDYITAQLHVYKALAEQTARIDPIILVGKKAWKRWRFWKYRYDRQKMILETPSLIIKACPTNIIKELEQTRKFLFKKFNGPPEQAEFQTAKNDLLVALASGQISPYYAILSPFMTRLTVEKWPLNLEVYRPSITHDIKEIFKIEFNYEFIN